MWCRRGGCCWKASEARSSEKRQQQRQKLLNARDAKENGLNAMFAMGLELESSGLPG